MISAPNRLLQLSGNKVKAFCLAVAAFLAGCMHAYAQKPGAAVVTNRLPFQEEYHIALMLPFMLNSTDLSPKDAAIKDRIADFYEGVLLAVEDLEAKGIKLRLHVYDTNKDSLAVISILKKPEMTNMSLVIGPVFDNEIAEVEKFCAVYSIPLVSPLKYYAKKTSTDFPFFNNVPVDSLQYYYMGDRIARAFPRHQVIVIDELAKGTSNSNNFKKGYSIASKKEALVADVKTPVSNLWNGKDSFVVFSLSKASAVMKAATGVSNPKATVIGVADWLDLDLNSYAGFEDMYFCDAYFVEQNDTAYKELRKRFRTRFGGDPGRFTFIGYDQLNFFGDALMAFGRHFPENIQNRNFQYTSLYFRYVRRGSIYENAGMNLFRFSKYQTHRVTWRD